jgi:PEP-CTERM/exosortase A-associated glycosyltransferase
VKILHVLDHSLPIHSGYTFRSSNILQEQENFGWTPIVVTSPKHEQFQGECVAGQERIGGLRHYRCPGGIFSKLPIVPEMKVIAALKKRLYEVVDKERPDIIHAHSPVLNVLPALSVGKKKGIPVVYEVRALWEDAAVDHGSYRQHSWKYQAVRVLETFACKKATEVIVISRGLRNDFIARGISEDKLTVVANGVDTKWFNDVRNMDLQKRYGLEGKQVVGFIGSFYRYEGLDLLVNAMSRLSPRWPALRLLLAGGGEVETEVQSKIDALGLRDKIIVTGRIPHNEVPRIYALTDILAYPRKSMRLTELVTPLKPLEGMAMGKAIIASDVGGHKELLANNVTGLLFEAGNPDALAAGLERLLSDNNLRTELGMNASLWVRKERSWNHLISAHRKIYDRALRIGVSSDN